MSQTYINTTCKVGQSEPCGAEAVHLIAVTEVADTGWATEARRGGVIGLCEFHATTPVTEWDNRRCACGSPGTTSLTPGEVVVHRRDQPCYIAAAVAGTEEA